MMKVQGNFWVMTLVFIMNAVITYAQKAPWSFTPSSVSHTIFISKDNISRDNPPTTYDVKIDSGDYIGVFFTNDGGILQNAGFTQWQGENTYITSYGNDGTIDGFKTGENFTFKIWKNKEGCSLVNIDAVYLSGGIYSHKGQFGANGISAIMSLAVKRAGIAYSSDAVCNNESVIVPVITNEITSILYKAQDGLSIDAATGKINPAQSVPGKYIISFQTDECLVDNEFNLVVNPSPNLDLPEVAYGCDTVSLEVAKEKGYTYLWNTGDTLPALVATQNGIYSLTVTNSYQCSAEKTTKVIVSQPVANTSIDYTIDFKPCQKSGKITIDPTSIQGRILPFTYFLTDVNNQDFTSANGVFNIAEGTYELKITDSIQCVSSIISIKVENNLPCDVRVITPNGGGVETLFIEELGRAQIFDRNGIKQREISIPSFWDGRNEAGEILPMGTYLILVNGSKRVVVTIVK